MAQATEIQAVAAMSDEDAVAIGYVEAASGDAHLAMRLLAVDLLRAERERDVLRRAVSGGYIRASVAFGALRP